MSVVPLPFSASQRTGQITLIGGTATISDPAITANSKAFLSVAGVGGTMGATYKQVASTGQIVITAIGLTGTTQALDTATLNYNVII